MTMQTGRTELFEWIANGWLWMVGEHTKPESHRHMAKCFSFEVSFSGTSMNVSKEGKME
jgi:hypothetical protein